MLAALVPPAADDGFRLLDGHYVGRVGCDHRGDLSNDAQPAGNISLTRCKALCNVLSSCRGLSFSRGKMHPAMPIRSMLNASRKNRKKRTAHTVPTTCLLKSRCTGRMVTQLICDPEAAPSSATDCVPRRSNVFNYIRVIPLAHAANSSGSVGDEIDGEATPLRPPEDAASWSDAFARLHTSPARVGMLYLNLGDAWPPWTRFILHAAAANREVDFYFLGAPLDVRPCTPNCARLPLDLGSLRERIRRHILNHSAVASFGAKGNAARKLCDLVPMWPALFPELSARHAFVGITEHDMLPGNLTAEFRRLRDDDDMMLPLERFPQPLTDANFMVYRSTPKMLHAYRRVPNWEQVVASNKHVRFDEWVVEPPSIMVAFQQMLFRSELKVTPAQRFLVQDVVIIRHRRYPRIDDYGANVTFRWRRGTLLVDREGPCICPKDVVPIYGITCCLECFHNPGVVLPTQVHTSGLEVLGFHFSAWKRRWRGKSGNVLPGAVPDCAPTADFDLTPDGFQCL